MRRIGDTITGLAVLALLRGRRPKHRPAQKAPEPEDEEPMRELSS